MDVLKGLATQSPCQQARDGPVHPKGSHWRRNSVPVTDHFDRHKGNPESAAGNAQKADRPAAQYVVP